MTHDRLLMLSGVGVVVLALLAAVYLLLSQGGREQEIARRIGALRQAADAEQPRSTSIWPALVLFIARLGAAMRGRILSGKDSDALAKTLAAAGFEPSKAIPIFIGAKIACLFGVPILVLLGTYLLGYSTGKQVLCAAFAVAVGMMLPNWVLGVARRRYQAALRRGIPDALDLLVVCAEAGLGLESAVDRVAQEMRQSNPPVGVEFSLLNHEMRIMPDRRIALTNMVERTGQPAVKRLAGTIAQTLKYGTPLSQGLRTLAAEMRNERMIQFEERAGKLPALLVMPMMLFILPCLFIIILGQPAVQLMTVFKQVPH